MEYVPTNLPRYWKIQPRSKFADIVVQPQHVFIFSQDGQSLTVKLSDGTFKKMVGDADVTLGYVNSSGNFQKLIFTGTSAYADGEPEVVSSYYSWNIPLSSDSPSS